VPEPFAYNPARARRSLITALIEARAAYGGRHPVVVDGEGRALSYDQILRAAFAVGRVLSAGTKPGDAVGVLLPTGMGSVIAVYALWAFGRVPAMLNFTAGLKNLKSAITAAKIERVITAHRFIEMAKLDGLAVSLTTEVKLRYLEEARDQLRLTDKLRAAIEAKFSGVFAPSSPPDSPAVILFTSGTEGEPKGVVLSHANILANIEQARAHFSFLPSDIVFNPLPTFHSFGLTVGALMPLCLGLKTVLHPSPRQPKEIVRRIAENNATILLATDTFVSQYARAAERDELTTLRAVVCGAERLREETRQLLKKRSKAEILEGYGVTEASPVLSSNQLGANHHGTVGRLLPGIQSRTEPVEGIPGAGRLFVKGPNVMLGYLKTEQPGVIVPPPEGWHDTGDVVSFDDGHFLAIRGRLKRFAKVGGETVSLTGVENCASALWPDHYHAAIAVADGRRGESIVLVTTNEEATRSAFLAWARDHGVAELAAPRRIVSVPEIPILGTGKTDYMTIANLVAEADDAAPQSLPE
jgi:acyl-[acyl-carrier-protein]-phospholipid O-acyltransferase / long-chain-fatty-acid--[acyl-carrier-protein] ligase